MCLKPSRAAATLLAVDRARQQTVTRSAKQYWTATLNRRVDGQLLVDPGFEPQEFLVQLQEQLLSWVVRTLAMYMGGDFQLRFLSQPLQATWAQEMKGLVLLNDMEAVSLESDVVWRAQILSGA